MLQDDQQTAPEQELAHVTPVVTYTIAAMCVAMFLVMTWAGGSKDYWTLFRFGANYAALNKAGQVWRIASATFIHIGLLHLLLNMYSLLVVGPRLEQIMGNAAFAFLYAVSGLAGGIASTFFGHAMLSAGASGAIFGLFGAGLFLNKFCQDQLPAGLRRYLLSGFGPTILYNLLYGFSSTGIDNAAHIGGLIGGLLVCLVLARLKLERLRQNQGPVAVMWLVAALLPAGWLWGIVPTVRYPTMASYPRRPVQPPGVSYRLNLPLFDQPEQGPGGLTYSGPGHVWVLKSVPLSETERGLNFGRKTDREQFVKDMNEKQKIPFSHEVVTVGGRIWLVLRMEYEKDRIGFLGATTENGQCYMPLLITLIDDEKQAKELYLNVLETVQPR